MKRIILLSSILLLSLFAIGVYAQTDGSLDPENKTAEASRVERLISENTPVFIKDGMQVAAKFLEDFRMNAHKATIARADKISKDIEFLDEEAKKDKVDLLESGEVSKENPISRALKTVQLFFLKLVAGIFASKIAFYGLSLLIFIIILRYMFG
jgi:hypothetical protein